MIRIVWSPLAIERVLEAASYIAFDKEGAAENWVNGIFAAVDRLAAFPQSGRMVPEIGRSDLREVIYASHRVIYRLEGDQVLILTVRSSRQLLDLDEMNL